MTEKEIFELMKWYITRPKQIQIEIWKAFGTQDAEKERQKFAKTIKAIKARMLRDKRKYIDREEGLKELQETTRLRIAAIRKPRRKITSKGKGKLKRKVKLRLQLIEQLREEGLGWRLIARYLAKHAGLQISHVHLYRLYRQLKEQDQQEVDDQGVKIIRTQDPSIVIRKR